MLRLLGVLDSHPPEKVHWLYTQITERWGGDKSQQLCSPNTSSPELLRPGDGTKRRPNRVCASEDSECLNLSGLDLEGALSPGPALDGSQQSNLEPKQC